MKIEPNTRWSRKQGEGYATVVEPPRRADGEPYDSSVTKDGGDAAWANAVHFVKQRGDEECPDWTLHTLSVSDFLERYEGGSPAI